MSDFTTQQIDDFSSLVNFNVKSNKWQDRASSEEALLATIQTRNEASINTYLTSKQNMLTNGEDPTVNLARDAAAVDHNNAVAKVAQDIAVDEEIDDVTKETAVRSLEFATPESIDMQRAYLDNASAFRETVQDLETSDEQISRLYAEQVKEWDQGFWDTVADFGDMVVPLNFIKSYHNIGKVVLGKTDAEIGAMAHIDLISDIREELATLPADRATDVYNSIVQELDAHSGWFTNNNAMKVQILEDVYSALLEGNNPSNTTAPDVINQLFNTFEFLGVVKTIGSTVKGMGKLPGALSNVRKGDPELTETIMASAIEEETKATAKALGVKEEELMDHMFPTPDVLRVEADGVDAAHVLKTNERLRKEIRALLASDSGAFRASEKESVSKSFKQKLEEVEGVKLYEPGSSFSLRGVTTSDGLVAITTEDGVIARGIYTAADGTPFTGPKKALERAKEVFGEDASITVLKKNTKTGDLEEAAGFAKGEYFIQVVDNRPFVTQNIAEELLIHDGVNMRGLAKFGSWLGAPTARFRKWISEQGLRVFDTSKAIEHKLYTMIEEPFIKLNTRSQDEIITLLQREADEKHRFTANELLLDGVSPEVIRGKLAINQMNDTLYLINNQRLYNRLSSEGFSTISHGDSFKVAGKVVDETTALKEAKVVYDPVSDSVKKISAKEIEDVYANGGTLARSKGSFYDDLDGTDWIIVQGDTTVSGLSRFPLKYNEGYSTRIYKNQYFITETIKGKKFNGSAVEDGGVAVHVVGDLPEAKRLVAKLNASADEGVTYDWRHDRSLAATEREQAEWQLNQAQGRLIFSSRGERLGADKVRTKGVVEEVAAINDPVESFTRTIRMVSNKAATEDWINSLKARFINSYGHMTEGKFPTDIPVNLAEGGKVGTPLTKDAKAFHNYIRMMEGFDDTNLSRWWQTKMLSYADSVIGDGSKWYRTAAAKTALAIGEQDPFSAMRRFTFNVLISANPFRQMILQSQQAMFLAGYNPKYIMNPVGLGRDSIGLRMGAYKRNTPEWEGIKKRYSKAMGVSPKEYEEIVDGWRNSGLPFSIDAQILGRDAAIDVTSRLPDNVLAKIGMSIPRATAKTINAAKKIGFDWGEHNNLTFTWLAVRDRFIRDNPGVKWNSKKALEQINGEARTLSLSMTTADAYGYQRGWAAMMTQFLSVQHKAWAATMPAAWGGNQAISNAVKARLLLAQVGFYGAAGVGLAEAYDASKEALGIELSPAIDDVLRNGIGEALINKSMTAITDETTEVAFGENFAPMAGWYTNVGKMLFATLTGDEPPIKLLAGPSSVPLGRVGDLMSFASNLYNIPAEEGVQVIPELGEKFFNIFSGFSNYTKAKAMMKYQAFVDKNLDPLSKELHASTLEAMWKFAGIGSHKETRYWKTLTDLSDNKKALKQDAKVISDLILDISRRGNNGDTFLDKELRQLTMIPGIVTGLIDEPERRSAIQKEVARSLRQHWGSVHTNSAQDGLIKAIMQGQIDRTSAEGIANRIGRDLTPEEEANINKLISYLYEAEEK